MIQGIPKAKKIEFIVEKAAELGVMKVFPAFMDRSIVKPTNKDDEKHDRLLKKALSACEQSKRNKPRVRKEYLNWAKTACSASRNC